MPKPKHMLTQLKKCTYMYP